MLSTSEDLSAPVVSRDFIGPLRQVRLPVPKSGGWVCVLHQVIDRANVVTWNVGAVHPNHMWEPVDGIVWLAPEPRKFVAFGEALEGEVVKLGDLIARAFRMIGSTEAPPVLTVP